jgi:glycosyltransferase involved in cell wall biosynthesis
MPKIVMVAATDYTTDARVRRQAEALVQDGYEVGVIALGRPGQSRIESSVVDGVRLMQLPIEKFRGASAASYVAYYWRFARMATRTLSRERGIDLVQAHSMPEALVFTGVMQRLRGVPVLLDIHDLTSKLFESKMGHPWATRPLRAIEWASIGFATQTITVHEPYARMLHRTFGKIAQDIPIVMNVPDTARWQARPWRDWAPTSAVFAFHGMYAHRYGVLEMIKAFSQLRSAMPDVTLMLRGDGDARQDMCNEIAQLDLQDSVDISPGYVALDDVVGHLASADIGVVPYHLDEFTSESLPTKLLEYAALGMPVIASRLPYFEEVFGDTVWWAKPGDHSSLAAQMAYVAGHLDEAREKSMAAQDVVSRLSWEKQRAEYLKVVHRLISGDRDRRGSASQTSGREHRLDSAGSPTPR